jgi:putative transposase
LSSGAIPQSDPVEARPNARWLLDFASDQFANGRRFRVLNIVDDRNVWAQSRTRPSPNGEWRLSSRRLSPGAAKPARFVYDNGTEFTSNAMLA